MTKGLPDPPARATTASSSFSTCECSHPLLFAVRSGVDYEDALVHLSTLLKGALERQQLAGRGKAPVRSSAARAALRGASPLLH